jgi:hypothetical protein
MRVTVMFPPKRHWWCGVRAPEMNIDILTEHCCNHYYFLVLGSFGCSCGDWNVDLRQPVGIRPLMPSMQPMPRFILLQFVSPPPDVHTGRGINGSHVMPPSGRDV